MVLFCTRYIFIYNILLYLHEHMYKVMVFLDKMCYNKRYGFLEKDYQMKNDITSKLERLSLDKVFDKLRSIIYVKRPNNGWIKAIRESLGMSVTQLAKRVGVGASRIYKIENDEIDNKLTLNTLENIARALNCELFYVLVPEKPLQTILEEQAKKKAEEESRSVTQSMFLEGQNLDMEDQKEFIKIQSEDLLHNRINRIWEDN